MDEIQFKKPFVKPHGENLAWTRDHRLEPVCQFDHDEVSRNLGELAPERPARRSEVIAATADALREILNFAIRGKLDASSAGRKIILLGWCLEHPGIGGQSQSSIAGKLGVSKQALSHIATQIHDRWGLRCRAMKREGSREIYRQAQSGARHWRARRAAKRS